MFNYLEPEIELFFISELFRYCFITRLIHCHDGRIILRGKFNMLAPSEQVKLEAYFRKLLAEGHQVEKVNAARYVICTLLTIIAGSSGLPVLSIAQMFAKKNKALTILYSYGFVTSVGALNIWGLFDFIKYLDVKASINPQTSLVKKRSYAIISFLLAVTTATPSIPVNYRYNNSILLTTQGLISDTTLLSCTYQRMINSSSLSFLRASAYQKKALDVMELLSQELDIGIKCFIALTPDDQKKLLTTVQDKDHRGLDENNVEEDSIKRIVRELVCLSNPVSIKRQRNKFWRVGLPRQIIIYVVSPTLPLLWAYVSFNASLVAFKEKIYNSPIALLFTLPPVILSYVLELILTRDALTTIYDTFISMCDRTFQRNLPWLFFPRTEVFSVLWGLFTVAFSFASRAQITEDFIPSPYNDYFVPIMIAITLIFKSSSLQSLISDAFHYFIRKFANDFIKDLGKFIYAVEKFQLATQIATTEQRVEFVNDFSDLLLVNSPNTELHAALIQLKSIGESEGAVETLPRHSCNPFAFFSTKKAGLTQIKSKVENKELASLINEEELSPIYN